MLMPFMVLLSAIGYACLAIAYSIKLITMIIPMV